MSFPGSLGVLFYPCISGCACSIYTQLVLNLIDFLNSFTCWWTVSIWCLNFSQLLSKKYSVFCPAHFSIGIRFKCWFYSNLICPVLIFFFFGHTNDYLDWSSLSLCLCLYAGFSVWFGWWVNFLKCDIWQLRGFFLLVHVGTSGKVLWDLGLTDGNKLLIVIFFLIGWRNPALSSFLHCFMH